MATGNPNYYSNPAFCQQSEFYNQRQRALSPERRHPPVGAHNKHEYIREDVPPRIGPKPKIVQRNNSVQIKIGPRDYVEPEEMLVDDPLVYKDSQKYLDISNGNVYEDTARPIIKPGSNKGRYAVVVDEDDNHPHNQTLNQTPNQPLNQPLNQNHNQNYNQNHNQNRPKHRYEYIPMQEPSGYPSSPRKIPTFHQPSHQTPHQEDVEFQGRVHRYAVIPAEEDIEKINKNRYALVPVSEIKGNNRYAVITSEDIKNSDRYDYIDNKYYQEQPQTPRKGNPVATQKLHELLTTPKKIQRSNSMKTPSKVLSPPVQRRVASPDPFRTPQKSPPKLVSPPRAQQKLNYTLSTRQPTEKRHTAVIAPICSSPVQSVYSETTFSNKTESWMNLSLQKPPVQATLAVAAVMMILCGGLTAGLCFYMVSVVGRMYYLDFGTISGFACLLLGLLGFRSRNCHWLPNRNYISGYIVLSAFSLLTCAGLVVLLALQPKPGSPLADVTSGAVCGISGLSLILASAGVVASFCFKYPPPDNRVQHCARGFTV